jgi:L-Ala-D/L-Glu epimerase
MEKAFAANSQPNGVVAQIETVVVSTSMPRDLRVSHGVDLGRRDHVIVRVTSTSGQVGYGEASPLTFFTGETAETAKTCIDRYLAPWVIRQSPIRIDAIHRGWERSFPGHRAAKCALDVALYDLKARTLGLSVADLLGGRVAQSVPMYKAIGFGTEEQVVAEGQELWDLGLRSFKLKIGDHPDRDLRNLIALRERFGEPLEIILDGNGGYSAQEAVRFLRKAEPWGVSYVEQPVPGHDIEGMAFVRAHGGVSVMADESVYTLRDTYQLIRRGAVDLIGIKLIKTAGFHNARKIADFAYEMGVPCVVISPFDTQLGVSASVQLASTFPSSIAHGLGTFLVATSSGAGQLEVRDGALVVPTGPGLGVEPDGNLFETGESRSSLRDSEFARSNCSNELHDMDRSHS